MFTDVAGFSKHSAIDEQRTLRALNRDFDIIYRQVAAHGGQVLNTMGDGMMIVFNSATSCMQCALAIQGDLHRQCLSRPIDGVLQHRIGVHVGDIILNGKNTMGDGVNQASRIETLARPDSIAMSREFHDMVKDKVRFSAKYLGPRRARNIPEAIPIFEIPPIDDAIRQQVADSLFVAPNTDAVDGATGRRGALFLIAAVILIFAAASPIFLLRAAQKSADEQARRDGRGFVMGKADGEVAKDIRQRLGFKDGNNAPVANNEAANDPASNNAPSDSISLTPDQISDIAAKTNVYDYAGVAAEIQASPGATSTQGMVMIKKYENLVQFKQWLSNFVLTTSEASPIQANIDGQPAQVYSIQDGIAIVQNNQLSSHRLWDLKPATVESIAKGASQMPTDSATYAPELTSWIGTFREVHGLDQ
ncbi:MAG: adenylate/guanylate cyclase domain-containing protein [Armatimonadetes bacterium]|nr:adenylate/guanylate cyclase domain-containing protein [Armatimonadota bacterium]